MACILQRSGYLAVANPTVAPMSNARAVDTRTGEPGTVATRIDQAIRARFSVMISYAGQWFGI